MRKLKLISALCAAGTCILLGGCGGVPKDSIAKVDGKAIKQATLNHWMEVVAKSNKQSSTTVPDAPTYKTCIAEQRKQLGKPKTNQPKISEAQLRTQCKQTYEGLRDQAAQYLIQSQWLEGASKDLGINLSESKVKEVFETQKQKTYPKGKGFQKFLKDSGFESDDLLLLTRSNLLQEELRKKVTKGQDKVTDAEVTKFFKENKKRFRKVKLAAVKPMIKQQLESERQAKVLGEFFKDMEKKWKKKTECQKGFVNQMCSNAKAPEAKQP